MKPAVVLLVAGAAVLSLAACADWEDYEYVPTSGTIVYMEHEEEEWEEECGYEYEYDPISGKYKNVYGCDTYHEPECWLVEFETPAGDLYEDCTTKAMYAQLKVGDVYIEGQPELATSTPWSLPRRPQSRRKFPQR